MRLRGKKRCKTSLEVKPGGGWRNNFQVTYWRHFKDKLPWIGGDETLMLPLGNQLPDVQVKFHTFTPDVFVMS